MIMIKGKLKKETVEAEELKNKMGKSIEIYGSIHKIRKMRDFAFVLLRTKRDIIQCVYTKEMADFPLEELTEESCVRLTACVRKEERSRKGYELQIQNVEVLSRPESHSPIVINNKGIDASIEKLLDFRPITLRNEKERAIFKIQEGIVDGIREFLKKEKFTEIRSPKIVYAGAEGGANIFRLDYFGKNAYLAQSPQFYKQMMVGVYERVFEIAPVYRAEKHDTSRHLNEYTSVDFEMGYIRDYEGLSRILCKVNFKISYKLKSYLEKVSVVGSSLVPNFERV